MRKYLIPAILLALLGTGYYLYSQYGYLLTSFKNWPSPSSPAGNNPLSFELDTAVPRQSDPSLSFLSLPEGFTLNYFAKDIPGARSLASSPDGSLVFVGTRNPGVVYAISSNTRYTIAQGLNSPNGVAYLDGDLYVAEIHRIIKFKDIEQNYQNSPNFEVVYSELPSDTHHGWRYLAAGPDGRLYLGIGAPCNACDPAEPFASIASLQPDGTDFRLEGRGIRNTVGLAWNPADDSLWFTDNGRDLLGDNIPPDELNHLTTQGEHFGFPDCHGRVGECDDFTPPVVELGPHVAALGLLFYKGEMFPEEYRNKIIIAEHGSWNRTVPIGYRLTTVDLTGSDSADNYQSFVDGWLQGKEAMGRPVDLIELPDGSLLISDDLKGAVYRLTYSKE
jgi:glucose/arabinose dehydrogenase